jgi:hypothetical protein
MPGGGASDLEQLVQESAKPAIDNAPVLKLANITLNKPEDWTQEQPTSQMRVVQYALKSDKSIKVVGFNFGIQDMIKENIDRWKSQFSKVDNVKETKMLGDKITMVEISGSFKLEKAPMSSEFTDSPNYLMIAAIVPSNEGPFYFKAVGPKDLMTKEMNNFKLFLNSYKAN